MAIQDFRRLYRPSWAAWLALLAHPLWATIVLYILWAGPSDKWRSTDEHGALVSHCTACDKVAAEIAYADSIGRLDFIGLALSVLGVGLVICAFGSFFAIRAAAMSAAREEVENSLENHVSRVVSEKFVAEILKRNPRMLYSAVKEVIRDLNNLGGSGISDEEADEIAKAIADGESGNGKLD